jgi:hypothetical protein
MYIVKVGMSSSSSMLLLKLPISPADEMEVDLLLELLGTSE